MQSFMRQYMKRLISLPAWKATARTMGAIVLFLITWETLSRSGKFSGAILPPPDVVLTDIVAWERSGSLTADAAASLRRVALGFVDGTLIGLGLGIWTSVSRISNDLLEPIVELLRPIPPLAWIPLAILWFGLGDGAAAFLVSLGAFFPIFTGVRRGLAAVDPKSLEVARLYELSWRRRVLEVIVPQALPSIVSSLVVGMGIAWMIVITAELVGTTSGLGYAIQVARLELNPERVIAGMLVIGLIGFTLSRCAAWLESMVLPWKRDDDRHE